MLKQAEENLEENNRVILQNRLSNTEYTHYCCTESEIGKAKAGHCCYDN